MLHLELYFRCTQIDYLGKRRLTDPPCERATDYSCFTPRVNIRKHRNKETEKKPKVINRGRSNANLTILHCGDTSTQAAGMTSRSLLLAGTCMVGVFKLLGEVLATLLIERYVWRPFST